MADLFLGWDVGAWNCDMNRESRDALCALAVRDRQLEIVGSPWRGNLRDTLVVHEGPALVGALLERVGAPVAAAGHITIAIDTPLAWPRRMLDLVTKGVTVEVPAEADSNPYLFRAQELALFAATCRPLSTVRDMIGSQSTKGIHFLRRAALQPGGVGVWSDAGRTVVAIETYPAAAARDVEVARSTSRLLDDLLGRERQSRSGPWQADVRDAVACALVAWLHRTNAARLAAPTATVDAGEGWIWLPANTTTPA
jgi:hypothetical protein